MQRCACVDVVWLLAVPVQQVLEGPLLLNQICKVLRLAPHLRHGIDLLRMQPLHLHGTGRDTYMTSVLS